VSRAGTRDRRHPDGMVLEVMADVCNAGGELGCLPRVTRDEGFSATFAWTLSAFGARR
jgi:hypothetical protein